MYRHVGLTQLEVNPVGRFLGHDRLEAENSQEITLLDELPGLLAQPCKPATGWLECE